MTDRPLHPERKDDTMTPPMWLGPIRRTAFIMPSSPTPCTAS
ncbi:MAG: hypothetical protein RLZZ362_2082 [Actinomycetota bacterium]